MDRTGRQRGFVASEADRHPGAGTLAEDAAPPHQRAKRRSEGALHERAHTRGGIAQGMVAESQETTLVDPKALAEFS